MFGGGTQFVETLDAILEFVEADQSMSDELVGRYRGSFQKVTSLDSGIDYEPIAVRTAGRTKTAAIIAGRCSESESERL